MAAVWIGRGRVEARLVGGASPHCLGHFVVDFENDAGAIFAVLLLFLLFRDAGGFAGEV